MTLLDAKNKTFDGDNFIFSGVVQGGEPTSRGAPDDGDPGSSIDEENGSIFQES